MREKLSRTSIVGLVVTLLGFGQAFGIGFDVDEAATQVEKIYDGLQQLWLIVSGPVIIWMRVITGSEMVGGLRGLLFKKA